MSANGQSPASLPLKVFNFFASFGLAIVVLAFLLLITLLGTLEQREYGLMDSQRKYFESIIVPSVDLGCCLRAFQFDTGDIKVPIPLPGGLLLMGVLFINMACGAVIRIRKGMRTIGVLIAHVAILFMLAAGFVSFVYKTEGAMPLFEGQTSDQYQSFHQRIVEIRRFDATGKGDPKALVIPMKHFTDLAPGKARTFHAAELPFELILTGYCRNSRPEQAGNASDAIEGYRLQDLKVDATDERNLAGIRATVKLKDGGEQHGLLWEGMTDPWTIKTGDSAYTLSLTRMKWKLPFAIRLTDFQRELHPGTMKAKKYTSHVVKLKDGKEEPKVITMNVPLRDQGYVAYQASFSMGDNVEQSVFTIAKNPSDQWPKWSCIMVAIGLLIHFIIHLGHFLRRALKPKPAPIPAA